MQKSLTNSTAEVWSQSNCLGCVEAKRLLTAHGINYTEKMIGPDGFTKKDLLARVPDARSVPQIFIDGEYVGGLLELKKRFIALNDND